MLIVFIAALASCSQATAPQEKTEVVIHDEFPTVQITGFIPDRLQSREEKE